MSWIEPKRNWKSTDIFSLADWTRIVSNARDLYDTLGASYMWLDCSILNSNSLPFYDLVNNLESNLHQLCITVATYDVDFDMTVWQPRSSSLYTHNPSYRDFNRWEQIEYDLKYATRKITNLYAGNFTAGNDKIRQSLGRCVVA